MRCKRNGGLAGQWYVDDGDIMCHPTVVLLFLKDSDVSNASVGAERNPLNREVIYCVNDLGAAPPEWRIRDVQNVPKISAVTAGSVTLDIDMHRGPVLGQGRRHPSHARTCSTLPGPADGSGPPPRESGSQ